MEIPPEYRERARSVRFSMVPEIIKFTPELAIKEEEEEEEEEKKSKLKLILQDKILPHMKIIITLILLVLFIIGLSVYLFLHMRHIKIGIHKQYQEFPSDNCDVEVFRLPSTVMPIHYVLEIQPDMDNLNFRGKADIHLNCFRNTNQVTLHAANLTIRDVKMISASNSRDVNELLNLNISNDLLTLYFKNDLDEDVKYNLTIEYFGILSNTNSDFYTFSSDSENSTAFTPYKFVSGRNAFPCFDEPHIKTTFDIILIRKKNTISLSNMPIAKPESRGNFVADIFHKSINMSAYSVAFFLGNYAGRTYDKMTVWCLPNEQSMTDDALAISNKVLNSLENIVEIVFELSKLDHVPLHLDKVQFPSKQNYGLIFYPKEIILNNKNQRNLEKYETLYSIMAFQISQQWFGNLISLSWWSDIWITEGISTFMEYTLLSHEFLHWNNIDPIIYYANMARMEDCTNNEIESLSKIEYKCKDVGIHDYLQYNNVLRKKSAAVIRMAQYVNGNSTFWSGIKKYLNTSDKINKEEKFWNSLSPMKYWTHLAGMPILTVKRQYKKHSAFLSQVSCREKLEDYKHALWSIPISFITSRHRQWNPNNLLWMITEYLILEDLPDKTEWILVNGDSIGFYAVNYDEENWKLLAMQLHDNHLVFTANQRMKIISDFIFLESLGYQTIQSKLDFYLYLPKEESVQILYLLINKSPVQLKNISDLMYEMKAKDLWEEFILHTLQPIYDKYSWNEQANKENKFIDKIRYNVLEILCQIEKTLCIRDALNLFLSPSFKPPQNIYKNSFQLLLCTSIHYGNKSHQMKFITKYRKNFQHHFIKCTTNRLSFNRQKPYLGLGWFSFVESCLKNQVLWSDCFKIFEKNLKIIIRSESNFLEFLEGIKTCPRNIKKYNAVESYLKKISKKLSSLQNSQLKEVLDMFSDGKLQLEKELQQVESWLQLKLWT
ncbi:leucyl-cystinyl aminopeptidase-like isoform X2 [Centruroides vittatus]|uniref:leucyl-cystinyl aminopeptidase-like isoform X2 n=1 Tax=Centruroides vittatus TaxID=120091 RepID=UPI00350FE560